MYREGKRASGRYLRIHVLPGNDRVGVAAVRAIGSIARRNRQRRRLREAARAAHPPPGFDWVLVAMRDVVEAPWPELLSETSGLMRALAGRWAEPSGCS